MANKKADDKTVHTEETLIALYELQQIDSKIDKIRIVRGELPLEVQDLEDAIAGLELRIAKYNEETAALESFISDKKNAIKDAQANVKKNEAQQGKVRNNREYDSLSKEIEYQNLEMQLSEKKIKEASANIAAKAEMIESANDDLKIRKKELKSKQEELDTIVAETEKEEQALMKKSKAAQAVIDERLLNAYNRIRSNVRNGLGVVTVQRDACGGCFNKIPPQRQIDIVLHKKVLVCGHCGRILVDATMVGAEPVEAKA